MLKARFGGRDAGTGRHTEDDNAEAHAMSQRGFSLEASQTRGGKMLTDRYKQAMQFAATVPWAMAFHGTADQWVYVSAQNNDPTGTIRVRLTIQGQVKVDESSSEPYGIAGSGVFCC